MTSLALVADAMQHVLAPVAEAAVVGCQHVRLLAVALPRRRRLRDALATLRTCLAASCRLNPRRGNPNTYQLHLAVSEVAHPA